MSDYMEKIRNLLALAESPNEYEARDALLKARRIMAKHRITEKELGIERGESVIRKMTGITYSMRRDPWVYTLGKVIAENHCCRNFQIREKRKQSAEIGFIGFAEDVSVCMEIFQYAVDCVRSVTKRLRKKSIITADGYGFGFADGLKAVYQKQQTEEGWGLVLVVPEDADKQIAAMSTRTVQNPSQISAVSYARGIIDGQKFHKQKRIGEG